MKLLKLLGLVPGFGVVRSIAVTVWAFVSPILQWIFSDWRHLAIIGLLAVIAHEHLQTIPQLQGDLVDARKEASLQLKVTEACQGTVNNLKAAARQAEAAQAANLERVKAERAANDERIVHDYQDRIADLRARADALAGRLSRETARTSPGLSGNGAVPAGLEGARGSAEASGDQGFSAASGASCAPMTLRERLIASQQAEQLDALIDAVRAQEAVRTSP